MQLDKLTNKPQSHDSMTITTKAKSKAAPTSSLKLPIKGNPGFALMLLALDYTRHFLKFVDKRLEFKLSPLCSAGCLYNRLGNRKRTDTVPGSLGAVR